jgi:Predicted enzyme related to lactoylglutathione lyase
MVKVSEVAFVGYPVTDVPRARAFYENVLGLKCSTAFGEGWIEYDIGACTLAVVKSSDLWKPSADGPAVALEVEDFDAAIATLKAVGSKFILEPMDSPVCRIAVVQDPDGNGIAIHQRKANAGSIEHPA